MRPEVPGFILDASALRVSRHSLFARTLISRYARQDRPIVVPAAALVAAAGADWIDPAELDAPAITVTALTQAIAPAVALIMAGASAAPLVETAHTAYEAVATGYPVLTADRALYEKLAVRIDLEELPE
ncbi:MAG: hypothetical protein ACRDUA_03305 [Micromonosporaceae bacterium]